MHVALVITDAPFYEPLGYAAEWIRALEAEGARVDRLAGIPAGWATRGPEVRYDLAVPHVLAEEVAALAPTFRLATLLERCGVPLLNPVTALVASADKLVTHAVWAAAGIPQPAGWDLAELRTWPCPGRQLVVKPALGDGARDISLVGDLAAARAAEAAWRADEAAGGQPRGATLLQEWVAEPTCLRLFATPAATSPVYEKGRDAGALITDGRYVRSYPAPPEVADLAQRMVASLGGGLMGVDVLVDGAGRLLALEANAPFGWNVCDPEQGAWLARAALDVAR
ncbi:MULTISPECIES: ATP-grasp domain-containing protein [unclassified Blastococcus]